MVKKSPHAKIYGESLAAGFVMMLQFRYQRAKLYRQVAMGKKHHMSVSQGEANSLIGRAFVSFQNYSMPRRDSSIN